MIYLLDVNALVALGFAEHIFHHRVAVWLQSHRPPELATCSITELGFVRVLAQAPMYGLTIAQARSVLARMKQSPLVRFRFFADALDLSHLPAWVKAPKQLTDGHLVELAAANGSILATLDENIPSAYVIPK
ncbi:MAG TPA: PIN domain-containing protein [Candidatus Binatia bacterium]|nr:PIN domain-containing protein [Candidatus Binatia bacterium]